MSELTINGRKCLLYECDEQPQVLLIQPVGEHEDATLDTEIEAIKEAVHVPFVFAGLAISDWEDELTPWHDPNISPRQSVGDHAFETLGFITEQLMPYIFECYGKLPIVLGGYSLAGLFARWAVCKEECFDAVAAASPSLWIVAWKGFLGDREEITKNKAIAQVGANVRWEYDHLQRTIGSDHCTLVWEKGGHFVTPHLRLARAFAWCIKALIK